MCVLSTKATESYAKPVVPTSTVKSNLSLAGSNPKPTITNVGVEAPLATVHVVEIIGSAAIANGVGIKSISKIEIDHI